MTIAPRRMDTSLTSIKNAIAAAQQDLQVDFRAFPQEAVRTAGAVLKELEGDVHLLITELKRDAERPIGKAAKVTP